MYWMHWLGVFSEWLPNSNFTVPLELIKIYEVFTDIWICLPFIVKSILAGFFLISVFFRMLRILTG